MSNPSVVRIAASISVALSAACSGGGGGGGTGGGDPGGGGTTTPDVVVTDSLGSADDHALSFGSIGVGATQDATVTVSNAGTGNLAVGAVGTPPAPFSKVADGCSGQTLAPGASCTLTIRFAPTALTASSATFTIPSDDPDSPSVAVSVGGTGKIRVAALAGYERVVLTFTWIDPANRDGGYNLYSSTDGTSWTKSVLMIFSARYEIEGLTTGTTYYYKASATDGGVESEISDVVSVTPRAAFTSWNFDDGTTQGWTRGGYLSTWGVTSSRSHSPDYCVTDSAMSGYGSNEDSWLASPSFDLSGTTAPTLNFWRALDTQAGWDFCKAEVSADGGATFTTLWQTSGTATAFAPVTVDLAPYATSTQAVVRFRLTASPSVQGDGCWFDDVVITE